MDGVITFQSVTFIIALGGVAFGIYHALRNPDINNDKAISVLKEELKSAKEITALSVKTAQNDIHSLGLRIESLDLTIKNLSFTVATLTTIIDERLPRK